jgi:hypothetical protein
MLNCRRDGERNEDRAPHDTRACKARVALRVLPGPELLTPLEGGGADKGAPPLSHPPRLALRLQAAEKELKDAGGFMGAVAGAVERYKVPMPTVRCVTLCDMCDVRCGARPGWRLCRRRLGSRSFDGA